jgi:hypothetical protein
LKFRFIPTENQQLRTENGIMRILLLSQYFPPEVGSAAAKMAEMAAFLKGRGHQVEVVSQVPNYPQGVVYPGYEGVWFRREFTHGVPVTRTWAYASPERSRFKPQWTLC